MKNINLVTMVTLFILMSVITVSSVYSYTREQSNGGPNGYDMIHQSKSTTTCYEPGFASCPNKEDWQTDLTRITSDGCPVKNWDSVDKDVENNMRDSEVPDRNWNDLVNYKSIYTGTFSSNYYYEPTKQFIYRTVSWTAHTLKDYKYVITVNVSD